MSLPPHEPDQPVDEPSVEPRLLTRSEDVAQHDALFAQAPHKRFKLARPTRKLLRRMFIAFGAIFSIAGLALVVLAVSLRHSMQAALPQLDGELRATGLQLPVTVARNAQGVPSITAANLDDLLFAQGFVTAQDRLWQMDMLRRHAAGDLAEILGSNLIPHDRLQRTLQLRAAADRATAALQPDQLHQLAAYARGVNAFITQASDPHNNHLPVEFHLLHYTPAPWTPRDTLLVSLAMFQDLSTEFPTKLRREALAAHLPAELLPDLYPVGSWRDRPPAQPAPDLTIPKPEIEQIPLDPSQSELATPADILHLADQFPNSTCAECRAGSNNWAVAASHSASGAPLLSNDMHLSLGVPDIWYEATLHSPELDVTGFTLPGTPFIIVGRNQHVAWGFTSLTADVQDIRVEHLRGKGATTEFQHSDGSWSPVRHHTEHIRVRGGSDVDLDVRTTSTTIGNTEVETPLIAPILPSDHRGLALLWTALDPRNITSPFLGVNTATSGGAVVAALATFGGPGLNLIYADDARHIGYHAIGRIPIRGPAEHHPRAVPPPLPIGPPPPDEDPDGLAPDDGPEPDAQPTPQALTPAANHGFFLEAAFHRAQPVPQKARKLLHPPRMIEVPEPQPIDTQVTETPRDYTIGSPISPVPVDALDATQLWSGYIPYDEMPSVTDPPDGVLATANSRITADDYPYAIALDWAPPYRSERIYKLLAGRSNLAPADMLAIQNDIHSEFDLVFAQRLAYALDHASHAAIAGSHDEKRLRQAADILRTWSGDVSANGIAPTIVTAARNEIWPMLLLSQFAAHDKNFPSNRHPQDLIALYQWNSQTVALEDLLQHTPARWLPKGFANWNDFLTSVLEYALKESNAPSDLSSWRFGPTHPAAIDHPVFSLSPLFNTLLAKPTGSGPRPSSGDPTTIKAIQAHFGPSERFTADLADAQRTNGNITTGESGNPASAFYFDQFLPWLNGTTFSLPLHPTEATHTLTLLP